MKSMKSLVVALAAGLIASSGIAGTTSEFLKSRLSAGKAVQLGVWHASLTKGKKYAEQNGVPLIAVWSNGDSCGHCIMFEQACNTATFKNWMKTSGCVFTFAYPKDADGGQGGKVYNWCYKNQSKFPLIRIYWKKNGKQKINTYTMGDTVDGYASKGKATGKAAKEWFESFLKKNKYTYTPKPAAPKYNGGEFDVDDSENSRIEVEIDNLKDVTLPLTRTNAVAATSASTNTVIATYPDGTVQTNVVMWDEGESAKSIVYDTSSLANAGDQIELVMLDAAGKAVATNHITAVAEVPNSPKNPRWIGEKTEDELEWGEWTMDLDAATNKVKAFNAAHGASMHSAGRPGLLSAPQRAYTLMLIGGSLWCPDCFHAEEFLFDTDKFRNWATEKNVACVAIDEPRFGARTNPTLDRPTLLTRKGYKVGYNGVTNLTSGAGYLSRKGISDEDALQVLARNLAFVNNTTTNGGYCLPDNTGTSGNTGSWKTGIPCILILRDDGSVAGRLFQFSNSTAALSEDVTDALLKRLDELLEQVDDAEEETNDSRYTTSLTIGRRHRVEGKSLSFTDTADVYLLNAEETSGKRMLFSLSALDGSAYAADTELSLKVVRVSGAMATTVAVTNSLLSDGVSLSAEINTDDHYLVVSYPMDGNSYAKSSQFALTNPETTLCRYSLASDFVVKPTEVAEEIRLDDERLEMSISLESNKVYRITGIADNGAYLEHVTNDLYTAKVTADVTLALAANVVTNQMWNPGKVGFATTSAFTAESAGVYAIRLSRTGGVSGTAAVKVSYNAERSSKLEGLVKLPDDLGETRSWGEGDSEEQTIEITVLDNPFADGDQALYFTAETDGGDAEPGIMTFRLTLRDNDKRVPGKLEISRTDPSLGTQMTTFARAGENVTVAMSRVDGADGELAATLSASAGNLDETAFSWPGRDTADRTATLALPGSPGKVKVTLTPVKGTAVNTSKRILTVEVLDANVPGFEQSDVKVSATRYVPVAETRIKLDGKATDAAIVKVCSGALPAGMKWSFDKDSRELVISGVPTKAGNATATFRAYNGKTAGLATSVTVEVTDPATAVGATGEVLNMSIANTRTFADVPVFDKAASRLAGVLTLTLPRTGRASAKYRTVDGTASLSSASWSGAETDGTNTTLSAELAGMLGTNSCTLSVVAWPYGIVSVELSDPRLPDAVALTLNADDAWTKKNPATDYRGYYTVSIPQKAETRVGNVLASGDGYVTLKMNTAAEFNSGKVTYAGLLPNGRPFSGALTLGPAIVYDAAGVPAWSRPLLPLMSVSSQDLLAGAVKLTPGAADPNAMDMDENFEYCTGRCSYKQVRRSVHPADGCALFWQHVEAAEEASFEVELDAFGTYYNSAEDFASCCDAALGTTKLTLFSLPWLALPEGVTTNLDAGAALAADAVQVAGVNVTFAKATKKAKTKTNGIASTNTKKLTLSFQLATGIVSGTFNVPFEDATVAVTYRGVILPGWGSQECGDCGLGGKEAAYRPFISGTAWFNDTLSYKDAAGRKREVTVRRSCPISVGVKAGE